MYAMANGNCAGCLTLDQLLRRSSHLWWSANAIPPVLECVNAGLLCMTAVSLRV